MQNFYFVNHNRKLPLLLRLASLTPLTVNICNGGASELSQHASVRLSASRATQLQFTHRRSVTYNIVCILEDFVGVYRSGDVCLNGGLKRGLSFPDRELDS